MIYIGDGMTDVPCMKLVKQYGGVSIGVYSKSKKDVEKLMYDGRINHYCKADYSKDGDLFEIVSEHIKRISIASPLRSKSLRQYKDAEKKLQAPNGEARVDADNNDLIEMRKG